MGFSKIFLLTTFIAIFSIVWLKYYKQEFNIPDDVYNDHYWGKKILKDGDPLPKDDETINVFKVVYNQAIIQDLHSRLNKTRFVEPLIDRNFEDGFNGNYLKKVVNYWKNDFDWKKQIDFLNSFPQFTTQIEGLNIHFVRIKPLGRPKIVKPIVLVNGWPSNYYQYYKLADLLRKPMNNDVGFEIIIPSRPGFGFSEHPRRSGFSIADSARIYVKLMKRLGFNKFFFVGEDWGAIEAHGIGVLYPDIVEGLHMNMGIIDLGLKELLKMIVGQYLPNLIYSSEFEAKQFTDVVGLIRATIREMGYFTLQSTKPETIGALLIDSPAGLAAYVLEKYSTWVNKNYINLQDGGLEKKLNLDELLTNVMIFWITENGAYSTRYYREYSVKSFGKRFNIGKIPVDKKVPVGFSIGEHEIDIGKRKSTNKHNIVKFDYLENTGHFSAFENPAKLNEHLRKFVNIVMELNKAKK